MAKRRKRKSLKSRSQRIAPEVQHELPGGFWRQVFAVFLIALAIFFVVSWFDKSGTVLTNVHNFMHWVVGFSAYLLPFLLVYLAVQIFRSEENWVSVAVWIASILILVWVSGLAAAVAGAAAGGILGAALSDALVGWMGSGLSIFIYLLLIFVTTIFILQVNPTTVFRKTEDLIRAKNHDESPDGELAPYQESSTPALEKTSKKFRFGAGHAKSATSKATTSAKVAPAPRTESALVEISDPDWKTPPLDLLEKRQTQENPGNKAQNAYIIQNTLSEFGINVEMDEPYVGPRVTQYTLRPPAGVNLSKIEARDKELALNLAVDKIRIEAPIPGTRLVGIEIPNVKAADVRLRGILESDAWKNATAPLTFAVGKDISGQPVVADLGKMPHLLIAGTTGSGKSVMTNTLISSLLYRNSPSNMKLIIVDPKQVEMASYEDIPHLLTPVITDVEKTLSAMSWAVNEMERRYTLMAGKRVKKIEAYNQRAIEDAEKAKAANTSNTSDAEAGSEDEAAKKSDKKQDQIAGTMPYIVIVIDEMADLMMMAGKDLEKLIVRIAQKGRAAGIHLVLATQRPEVKVITGLIKANIPGRIAFAVGSQVDSRIMLDAAGAEKLLGKGDMLMLTTEMMGKPRRIQGAWTSDEDIAKLTDYLRAQRKPEYNQEVISQPIQVGGSGPSSAGRSIGGELGRKFDPDDPIVRKAVEIILKNKKFSTSSLQTWLGKGHGFVAGLAIWFEEIGVIGPPNGNKPRDVLIQSMDEFDELVSSLE